jgi:tetratricopeptide (TPR) repeat protein
MTWALVATLAIPVASAWPRPHPNEIRLQRMDALRERAIASSRAGDFESAADHYKAWLALDPHNILLLRDLMWTLWQLQRLDEAAACARRIQKQRPADADARGLLARLPKAGRRSRLRDLTRQIDALASQGQGPETEPLLLRLIKLDERNPGPWNRLARLQIAAGRIEAAAESYRRSLALKPDQPAIIVALGRLLIDMREYEDARRVLADLEGLQAPATFYPLMGKSLLWQGLNREAAPYLDRAADLYPENHDYRYLLAWNAWFAGEREAARTAMEELYRVYRHPKAFSFLLEEARRSGDLNRAVSLLEERLSRTEAADEPWVLRLVDLYKSATDYPRAEALLDRYLAVSSASVSGWLEKANAAYRQGRAAEAEEAFRRAVTLNPSGWEAYWEVAGILSARGRAREAADMARLAWSADPTAPVGILSLAEFEYAAGRRAQARRRLEDWLGQQTSSQTLAILLYHGLAQRPDDPMLASTINVEVRVFADHMRALRAAGYEAVTTDQVADWLDGKASLPARPVLITFDDGRLDSLRRGDPVLRAYGLKAAMFAALNNSLRTRSPGYASLPQLRRYQDTGRWEIQSHGDLAHTRILTGPDGRKGLYLVNRRWEGDAAALESLSEWRKRLEADYRDSQDTLSAALGREPSAFAFPEGNIGHQRDMCNAPEAVSANLELARRYYRTAYIQNRYGLNPRSRDPWHLNRLEPQNGWSGEELVRRLADNTPAAQFHSKLLEWDAAEGRPYAAQERLAALTQDGVSPGKLASEEARLHFAFGDQAGGETRLRQAAELGALPDYQDRLDDARAGGGRAFSPAFAYESDTQGRRSWALGQTFDAVRTGPALWTLRYEHGEYRQTGYPSVKDDAPGLQVAGPISLRHSASAEILQHFLSGTARPAASWRGRLRSLWRDAWETRLEAGRELYGTSRALANNVASDYGDAQARWGARTDAWRAEGRGRLGALTDGNRRLTITAGASREILPNQLLRAAYRFTFDETRAISPDYYSPQSVRMHGVGPELFWAYRELIDISARYLPSYAMERGQSSSLAQTLEAEALWRAASRLSITPAYGYYATPSYRDHRFSISLAYRFEHAK